MNKAIVFTLTLVLAVTTITLTIATAQEYIPTETVSSGLVLDLAIMKEGFQLAAVVGDDLKIWDASTLAHQRTVDTNFEKAYSVAYRKGWYEAAVGGNNGRLEFWNTLAGSRMATVDPLGVTISFAWSIVPMARDSPVAAMKIESISGTQTIETGPAVYCAPLWDTQVVSMP